MSSCTRLVTGSLYSDLKICQKQLIGKQLRIEKTRLSHQVWSHGGSTFKKNMTSNGHFSRPAETDPYVFNRPTGIWGVSCIGWAVRSSRWPLFEWKEEQALWRSFQGWKKLNWKQHLKFNFTPLNSFLLCIINQTSKCHIYFLQWPAVPYPGDDPKTVGYCPGANTLIWFPQTWNLSRPSRPAVV